MLCKLHSILDNSTHPLHQVLTLHRSTFSNRLIPPLCKTERQRKSFLPVAIRLFNSSTSGRERVSGNTEDKCQMSLYPMPLYTMSLFLNHLFVCLYILFFIEAAKWHTAQIVFSYLCYFMLALFYFYFILLLSLLYHNCCTAISLRINKAS